jgi:peroxiredoxin
LRAVVQRNLADAQTRGLSVPVLMDQKGEVAEKFNVPAIPQTVGYT